MGIHKFILLTLLTLPLHLAFAEDDETEELLTAGELLKSYEEGSTPVSYTHLTLPTIYSV